ncbi:MAG: hypothetical protein IPJ69_10245 [Deltaproteobacteria bacterium]|nr:MAG: hypothetical protein IPJ69_10245 [Deltaproteobacteria bacterium]
MFWLLRKIFSLGVLALVVFFLMHVEVKGHLLKDYVIAIYDSPMVQQVVTSAKESLLGMVENLEKKKATTHSEDSHSEDSQVSPKDAKPLENLKDDEVKELEKVLKKQNQK